MSDSMRIGELCTRETATIGPLASLREAALAMREGHVGTLVVIEGGRPAGILTDRDIVVAVIAVPGARPEGIRVCDVMATPPVTVPEGAGVAEAVGAMAQQGVRRLCVVDADGRLAGVLSADDLLRALAGALNGLVDAMRGATQRELAARPTLRA